MTTSIALPTGTFRNNDPRSSGRRLVNCMSEIAPQTSDLDLKSKIPPVYLRRMAGISTYATAAVPNPSLLLHMDNPNGVEDRLLLMHFEGADGQLTTLDSSVHNWPVTMSATIGSSLSTAQARFGASSLHIPVYGPSSFPTAQPVNVPFVPGSLLDIFTTNAWTIEGWINPAVNNASQAAFLCNYASPQGGIGNGGLQISLIGVAGGTNFRAQVVDGGAFGSSGGVVLLGPSTPITLGTWHHMALVLTGGVATLFLDGVIQATTIVLTPASYHPASAPYVMVGSGDVFFSGPTLDCFVDEFAVSPTAVYTAAFTPPTSPLTPTYFIPTSTFIDSSLNAFPMTTTGGATISSVDPTPKFGSGDGSFPSVTFGSFVSTPVTAGDALDLFGPTVGGDFTIQGFFQAPAYGEPFVIVDYGDSSSGGNTNGIVIEVHDANTILVTPTIPGWSSFSNGGTSSLPANSWMHFALVRKGPTATFFLNGVALPNGAANWTTSSESPGQITFGASAAVSGASQPFFLDEVSVYKAALYAVNFTPQVVPTPNPVAGAPMPNVRGMWEMSSVTYVVIGDKLFSLSNDGTFTFPQRAASLTLLAEGIAGQGFVRMTDNTKCLFILVPGTNIGYTFTVANGFSQMLDETFTFFGAKDVWFIDSFMVFLALNGVEFYNDDGQTVSGTGPITFTSGGVFPREFGTDPFVGMCVDHRTVHMFGTRTTEGYVDAGNATESPFAAAPDAFMQIGCHPNCGYTVALQDQAVFWIANDLTVRRLNGQTPVRVSNSGIENFLELNKEKLGGAYAFSPTINGHPLWIVTFPLANKTLAYDCLTTEWFDIESLFANLGYWRPLCYFNSQGLQLVGDSQSSTVGFLDGKTFTEFGTPQTATFYTQSLYDKHNRIRHNRVELVMTAGGSDSITANARVTIMISNDSGAVYHNGQVKNLGVQGQRAARAIWFALGMSRDRAYGFEISDPSPTFTVEVTTDVAGGKW